MFTLQTDAGELTFERMDAALPVGCATSDSVQWQSAAEALRRDGATLVSLWGSDRRDLGDGLVITAAYSLGNRLLCVRLPLQPQYDFPSIASIFPAAGRMQRATYDLLGARALGDDDDRPWLRRGAWPADFFPLRREADAAQVDATARSARS